MPPSRRRITPKRTYTDRDKGKVYAFWIANDKNGSRTARETGFPLATIRNWIGEWEKIGGPPQEVLEEAEIVKEEFIKIAELVRDEIVIKVRELIPQATIKNFASLMTGLGILTDKIDRSKGMATQRVDIKYSLPSGDEASDLMRGFIEGTLAASSGSQEIIDAEFTEEQPVGLPAASEEGE